jgi:hypothetical protein
VDLKKFHILFISLATLCFVGFGLWCFTPKAGGSAAMIATGALGVMLGVATAVYGMWFYRNKIRAVDLSGETAEA